MKKVLLALASACLFATPAMADSPYVSVSSGVGLPSNSSVSAYGVTVDDAITYKAGVPVIGAIGLKGDGYRVEAAIGYQSSDVDKANYGSVHVPISGVSVSMTSYMANCYYDLGGKNSGVTPYLTAGLGAASLSSEYAGYSSGKTVFAWQAGAGVGLKASDNVTLDLGYRYFKPSKVNILNVVDLTSSISNILVGVRYNF